MTELVVGKDTTISVTLAGPVEAVSAESVTIAGFTMPTMIGAHVLAVLQGPMPSADFYQDYDEYSGNWLDQDAACDAAQAAHDESHAGAMKFCPEPFCKFVTT